MKITFVTNVPAPYRVEFFNELSKECNLTVCYERECSSERDSEWKSRENRNFKEIFCKGKAVGTDKTKGFDLVRTVKKLDFDHLIIGGYSSPSVILLILYCIIKKIPYFIETDGGFAKSDSGTKGILKKIILRNAKGIFTTCEELIRYYKQIGIKGEIYKYPMSSLRDKDICKAPASEEEKAALRKEIGMTEENIVITVGRFSYKNGYGKGYDAVLRAAKRLDKNIGWYIIGGEPTEEFVKMKEDMELSNLHYIGFKGKEELKKYYRAADLFALMTVSDIWGLVINEAMAEGVPVITTNRCIAGLELINDGENGYIVNVGDDCTLAEKVELILKDNELKCKMANNNAEKIKYWTLENMVKEHIRVLC